MAYLKINDTDFSMYVNELKVKTGNNYTAQTNARGDTVVDYINNKRVIEAGVIPLEDKALKALLAAIDGFRVTLEYRDPRTGDLRSLDCIVPDNTVEYYTIRVNNVSYKGFNLRFQEL